MASFPRIILASTSPRRIEMLKSIRLPFQAAAPDTDEKPKRGETPRALVLRLAREKAESVANRFEPRKNERSTIVIAADTIVVAPGGRRILGKPRDRAEALRMLGWLAGRTHTVYTGYCVYRVGTRPIARVVSSRVTMRKLTRGDIRRYVDAGESMDKAGAYAAQGFGATLIDRIAGSYTNVVGLPMAQLLLDLERVIGVSPFGWPGAKRK
jgi:septum formation protein